MNFDRLRALPASAGLALLLAACGGGGGAAGSAAPVQPQVTLVLSNSGVVQPALVVTLEADKAPATVANFLAYVKAGYYDGTVIHRHVPGFIAQGGGYAGPLVAGGTLPVLKPTNAAIALEDNAGLSNTVMTLAMARTGAADSATSQFFINLGNNAGLDRTASARGYAVFGSVTSGSGQLTTLLSGPCTPWLAFFGLGDPSACLPSPNITIVSATQTR
jgi:cyclophilin family peptidyl-prolyl cis-trans isomerase